MDQHRGPEAPEGPPPAGVAGEAVDPDSGGAARSGGPGQATDRNVTAETDLWQGRTSFKHFAGRITLWLGANVILATLVSMMASRVEWMGAKGATLVILAVLLLSGAFVVGKAVVRVLGTHYRLTSQRLFMTRGILSHTLDQTELIRVDDVRTRKTLLGRFFDVGTVTVITTDASDRNIEIEGVAGPAEVAEAIRSRMRALRGRSVYVESL